MAAKFANLKDEISHELNGLKDERLAKFSQKLIREPEILGVKTPLLRRLTKQKICFVKFRRA